MEKTDLIRAAQQAYHWQQAETFGAQLVEGGNRITDWSYRPPVSDDPETWRGVTRWVYVDYAYRWHIERECALATGHGPYFCPIHEEAPEPLEGWTANECWTCAWEGRLYDQVLAIARDLGKTFVVTGQAQKARVTA